MWGADCVAPISNWNTLATYARSLRTFLSFYDVPFTEANTVTSVMIREATPEAKKQARHQGWRLCAHVGGNNGVLAIPKRAYLKQVSSRSGPTLRVLLGQVRSCSRHAGGVVIAENLDKQHAVD